MEAKQGLADLLKYSLSHVSASFVPVSLAQKYFVKGLR